MHRQRLLALADGLEVFPLEDVHLGMAPLHRRRARRIAVGLRTLDQGVEELLADALAAPAGDDRDRELRRLLVDKPVPRRSASEEAVPAGAQSVALVDRDQRGVALRPQPST